MEDEVAALVSTSPILSLQDVSLTVPIKVIDNGSGMCKAGCKSFCILSSYNMMTYSLISSRR